MERLTAKNWKNSPHLQIEPTTQEEYDSQRLYTRLAELEDKLESGELIELPCEAHYYSDYTVQVYRAQDGKVWVTNPQLFSKALGKTIH